MSTTLPGIGMDSSRSQFFARQRLEAQLNLPRLFAAIDADPGIVGAGVVYIDADFNVLTLREFRPICSPLPKRLILREAQKYVGPEQFAQQVQSNPRESRLAMEATSAGLSCAGAYLSWVVIASGTVLVPFTAGASGVLVAIAWTAAGASSLQCVNGIMRTGLEVVRPETIDQWDSEEWYQYTSMALDGASLLGAGASIYGSVKMVQVAKAATGKSLRQILRGLNGQERAKLTKDLLSIKDPRMAPKLIKLQQLAGTLSKRFTPTELRHGTLTQIRDVLSAGAGLLGSALSGNLKNASIAIGLYEESDQ